MQTPMNPDLNCTAIQDLGEFEEIIFRDPTNWVDLLLRESEGTSLRITGPEHMTQRYRCRLLGSRLYITLGGNLAERIIDAFTTSLTRKQLKIEIDVVKLKRVKATGMVEVDSSGLNSLQPDIELFGPAALWERRMPVRWP
jgi:hypothetical protein